MFGFMKRHLFSALVILVIGTGLPAVGQSSATQLAAWQDMQADIKRLNAHLEDLLAANEALQRQLSQLKEEVRALDDRLTKVESRTSASADKAALKKLADAIEEVDRKRMADNKKVLEALAKLEKVFRKQLATVSRSTAPVKLVPRSSASGARKGYEYTIKAGDTLSRLVTTLRKNGFKISMQEVMDANPGVNWNRLQVGQKIFIPSLKR